MIRRLALTLARTVMTYPVAIEVVGVGADAGGAQPDKTGGHESASFACCDHEETPMAAFARRQLRQNGS